MSSISSAFALAVIVHLCSFEKRRGAKFANLKTLAFDAYGGAEPAAETSPIVQVVQSSTRLDGIIKNAIVPATMFKKYGLAWCGLALLAPGPWCTLSAEPPARTGKVLVLDNGRVLEGEIERLGDRLRIRREVGEIWLPAKQACCLCADFKEAYVYLRGRANLEDPDERLRLARWCRSHQLFDEARDETNAALAIRPGHLPSKRLLAIIHRDQCSPKECPQPRPIPKTEPAMPSTTVDFNAEAMGQFVRKVQPILMNTCANCHATGRGGDFKLQRSYEGLLAHPRTTRHNLTAVLSQVNRKRVDESPILKHAIQVHGSAHRPPLKNRETAAYRALERWVESAVRNRGPVRSTQKTPPRPAPTYKHNSPNALHRIQVPAPPKEAHRPPPEINFAAESESKPASAPDDPFDASLFNGQAAPDR